MVVVIALASALAYALAAVLQQQAASRADMSSSLKPRLLAELVRRPRWVAGVGANAVAYALRARALANGSLVLVQPLMVSGLLFALPLSALADRRPPQAREWTAAVAIGIGLALFVTAASPSRGEASAPVASWLITAGALSVPVAVLIGLARQDFGPGASRVHTGPYVSPGFIVFSTCAKAGCWRRPALLAAAGGILYALAAALTKSAVALVGGGAHALVSSWIPYALVVVAVAAVIVGQSAFQAGAPSASIPVLAVVEPIVSILIGSLLFHEHVARDGLAIFTELLGLAFSVVGIASLAASAGQFTGAGAGPRGLTA